ncbi:MAG TPA: glutamine amidotransferase [Methylocystis sp.]|nr:glutamine amidotransferase [Methylocystis sp.]
MRTALTITHVAFEDLGSLGAELADAGFEIEQQEASTADWRSLDLLAPDLVVVLGGPIGVYERDSYSFLDAETEALRARLGARRPTIGVCLGAQLMAAALGAPVYPGAQGKEIGWGRLFPGDGLPPGDAFAEFLSASALVLHWHGDSFDLPPGARRLASSDKYPNQAFAIGEFALGLQFHVEVTAKGLERWYVGHACELAQAAIDVRALRAQTKSHAGLLEAAARRFFRRWLDETFAASVAPKRRESATC